MVSREPSLQTSTEIVQNLRERFQAIENEVKQMIAQNQQRIKTLEQEYQRLKQAEDNFSKLRSQISLSSTESRDEEQLIATLRDVTKNILDLSSGLNSIETLISQRRKLIRIQNSGVMSVIEELIKERYYGKAFGGFLVGWITIAIALGVLSAIISPSNSETALCIKSLFCMIGVGGILSWSIFLYKRLFAQ